MDVNLSRHRFQGKFALVTGGSRGIGRAVAERFAAEGGTVAINHYNDHAEAAETLKSLGRISEAEGHGSKLHRDAAADVAKLSDVKAMIDGLVQGWGRLDILVNNAGIQAETPGDGFDAATFERIIAVNIMGQAYCAEHAIAHFLTRAGGGVVINTTSVHEIIPKPGFLAYSVSKGGMGNLTRTLALEFADRGIRVNAVGPGAVLTTMNDAWRNDPQAKQGVESHIPMGRAAEPEEMAKVFAFLASDDASYMTGQTLFACGGLTLYGEFKQNWSS
ncbi:MAG: glucose 1-dehydrogenase [Alphaproteobacteria bacterium]|nr:glucose 1-dehydrogenase [Beijerinckiaceae bacterium]NBQ38850.1 glucose 1-dehydrogenase [Alphaproteobacteria bacterium]